MPFGLTVTRGGDYHRLAEPAWENPLDISFSRERGGRWNPPGVFGALYLNSSVAMARAQVVHKLAGQPYDVEDLDPAEQHDLVDVSVPVSEFLDCVTDDGLTAVGLPADYPAGANQQAALAQCQNIAAVARAATRPGIACRSAVQGAPASEEELAVFEGPSAQVAMIGRRTFAEWFYS